MLLLTIDALNLARQRVGVEFAVRREIFAREASRIRGEFAMRKTLYSSMYIQAVRALIKHEYQVRASLAWGILGRVIDAERTLPSPELAQQAKSEIQGALETCADLKLADRQAQGMLQGGPRLDHFDLKHLALARTESEIDMAIFAAQRAPQPAAPPSVTIINPIGIVQTGAGSSAALNQLIGADERAALQRALAALRSDLEGTTEVSQPIRQQLLQVVGDAEQEIRSDRPNIIRVQGALSALATTVQTLGSARAAYELLRGAAAVLGIYLP
jgi:hypothetical protein